MTDHPVVRVLARVLAVMERAGVEFAIMGGFAVRHWSVPRPTFDVDLAVALDGNELIGLLQQFEADGFVVDPAFARGYTDSLSGMRKVNIGSFDSGSIWRVDIFLATSPFVRSAFDRRVPSVIEGMTLSVVTAEDLLLFKLIADRTKDRLDVEDMLLVCGSLDENYLRRWASTLGVLERLERALRASGRE